MISVIGTGHSGQPLVLCEMDEGERLALKLILDTAEDELTHGNVAADHRQERDVRAMITLLRRSNGLES